MRKTPSRPTPGLGLIFWLLMTICVIHVSRLFPLHAATPPTLLTLLLMSVVTGVVAHHLYGRN